MNQYIELNRSYYLIPNEYKYTDDIAEKISWGLVDLLSWSDLEKEYRVVILAEAGSGKTIELQQAAKRIRQSNKYAFFIRIEYISDSLEDAFDSNETGNYHEFQQWLSSEDEAWIFLDSVDEAKLHKPKDFEKAIRKISKKIGASSNRAHIIITSRITEWKPKSDLDIFTSQFPYEHIKASIEDDKLQKSDLEGDLEDFFEIETSKENTQDNSPFKVVSLAPLDSLQIKSFVEHNRISNINLFFDQIQRQDVTSYLSRPQDLLELISYWKENQRLGSKYEIIKANIRNRLSEKDPYRDRLKPLNKDKARLGARRIAAAVTLQKASRIKVPDLQNDINGVEAATVLDDWQPAEILALLERPIFDQAIYGTVRFHHHSVQEFLTSEWLEQLLNDGKSRRKIEALIFKKQYDLEVITPTLRPIVPWLAPSDQNICDKILKLAPELLFENGDPSRLPLEIRINIIREICDQINSGETYNSSINYESIKRFVTPDLDSTVEELLKLYRNNDELHTLLFGLVWHGKLKSCSQIAYDIAIDASYEKYSRIAAIRALSVTGTASQIKSFLENAILHAPHLNHQIMFEIIDCFVPNYLNIATLFEILEITCKPNEYRSSHIEISFLALIERLNEKELNETLIYLNRLLKKKPYTKDHEMELSEKYSWLLSFAEKGVEQLIKMKSYKALQRHSLSILSLSSLASHWLSTSSKSKVISDLISKWSELNRALFWFDVADARKLLSQKRDEPLTSWRQARIFRDYWAFDVEDFDYLANQILEQPLHEDKMVALTISFEIYRQNSRPRKWRELLKKLVSEDEKLRLKLHELLHPQPMTEQEKKSKMIQARFNRQDKAREKKERQQKEEWKNWLTKNTQDIRDCSHAERGTISNAQHYLYQILRDYIPNRNQWAHSNWKDLEIPFGQEVAEAYKDGAIKYWRKFEPKLLSEGVENPNSIPHGVVFGLTGLAIEAKEVKDWPSNLTEEEAILATKYALWEMNGFPNWLTRLRATFPNIVLNIFTSEIAWELQFNNGQTEQHYLLSKLSWNRDGLNKGLGSTLLALLKCQIPQNKNTLIQCLAFILQDETLVDDEIFKLAHVQLESKNEPDHKPIWSAVLYSIDPKQGINILKTQLSKIECEKVVEQFCMQFAVHLLGEGRRHLRCRENFKTIKGLSDLYYVLHQYIKIKDDIERAGTGTYSPTLRDDAQDARNSIFNILKKIPGKETYIALRELSDNHSNLKSKAWINQHAVHRATLDSDLPTWLPGDIRDFAKDAEIYPKNHKQLFDLAKSKILDLKSDLEDGDNSIANLLLKADGETELRNFIGGWLRDRSKGKYNITQEDELADAKRTDLRFLCNGFDAPVPTEIKIADNWSGTDIYERLENQLCNDYLRDDRSCMGIFLLSYNGVKKKWQQPISGEMKSFIELCLDLQYYADAFIKERTDIEAIEVIGIDLTKRSTPQYN